MSIEGSEFWNWNLCAANWNVSVRRSLRQKLIDANTYKTFFEENYATAHSVKINKHENDRPWWTFGKVCASEREEISNGGKMAKKHWANQFFIPNRHENCSRAKRKSLKNLFSNNFVIFTFNAGTFPGVVHIARRRIPRYNRNWVLRLRWIVTCHNCLQISLSHGEGENLKNEKHKKLKSWSA